MTHYFYPVQPPLTSLITNRLVVSLYMTLFGLVSGLDRWRNTRRAIAE